jgi:aminoglycoside phosphotransferase (APT) family kinase protein
VWLHSDLAPGNLLLVDGQLKAVIDFGGVGLGDPACDLPVAWNLLAAQQRPLFRTALRVNEATWQRGRGWALAIALVQLPYYQHTNPVLASSARHVIREVLADYQQGL